VPLEHPLDGAFHDVFAVLIFDGMAKRYDSAIAAAGWSRIDDFNEDFHCVASEKWSLEGHSIDAHESKANTVNASA
jgi:hypothetical protein